MFGFDKKQITLGDMANQKRRHLIDSILPVYLMNLYKDNLNNFINAFKDTYVQVDSLMYTISDKAEKKIKEGISSDRQLYLAAVEAHLLFYGLPEQYQLVPFMKYMYTYKKSFLNIFPENTDAVKDICNLYEFYEVINALHSIHTQHKGTSHASAPI